MLGAMIFIFKMLGSALGVIVPVLLSVALVTLLERKILSLMAMRVGPNKVGGVGVLQPGSDALKLFLNLNPAPSIGVGLAYSLAPILGLGLSLGMVAATPLTWGGLSWEFFFLFPLAVFSLGIYPIILMGWSSNNKYSVMGGVRGVAQTISYEISLAIVVMAIFICLGGLSQTSQLSLGNPTLLWLAPMLLLWLISCVSELNRTPFDFSEGESELVSGFNVEYGSTLFTLIFMAEYTMVIVVGLLTSFLFVGGASVVLQMLFSVWVSSLIVWFRATLPRFRYDLLMLFAWKVLLPASLGLLIFLSSWINMAPN